MTKSELVDRLCQAGGMASGRAESIVNAIFESIEGALKKGERTEIRGFGSFEIRSYGAYAGRNPRSGSTVMVKAKRLPFFKTGKELKDRINDAAQLRFATRRGPRASTSLQPARPSVDSPVAAGAVTTASSTASAVPKPVPGGARVESAVAPDFTTLAVGNR